jgi:hypothetical protein
MFKPKTPTRRQRDHIDRRKVLPFDERIWNEKDRAELLAYAEWHAAHPLCDSPRLAVGKEEMALASGELAMDPEDPTRVYHVWPFRNETPMEFQPNSLGSEANFDEVTVVANEVETELRLARVEEFDDPWWHMSVKETLKFRTPLDHYDDGRSFTSSLKALEKKVEQLSLEERRKQEVAEKIRAEKMEVSRLCCLHCFQTIL